MCSPSRSCERFDELTCTSKCAASEKSVWHAPAYDPQMFMSLGNSKQFQDAMTQGHGFVKAVRSFCDACAHAFPIKMFIIESNRTTSRTIHHEPPQPPLPVGHVEWTPGCDWIPRDDCRDVNAYACECRAANPAGPCTPCQSQFKGSQPAENAAPNTYSWTQWTQGCDWIFEDNCKNTDKEACRCRALNPAGPCTRCQSHPVTNVQVLKEYSDDDANLVRPDSSSVRSRRFIASFSTLGMVVMVVLMASAIVLRARRHSYKSDNEREETALLFA